MRINRRRGTGVRMKTKKKRIVTVSIVLALVFAVGVALAAYLGTVRVQSQRYNLVDLSHPTDLPTMQQAVEDDYVQLAEVRMHYVRYGQGEQPVVLIHGNGGNCGSLEKLARYLANDYSVYCVDSRCQGKSSDPGVITYDLMAADMWQFIQAKLTVKPYVLGHSDGGIVAIALASLYPDSVAAIMPCGANSHPDKFKFYFTWGVKLSSLFHKDKLNDLMLRLPDFTPDYLARITVPTLVVAGEYDIMPLSDTVYIHSHIAGSEIAIVKGADHSVYISQKGDRIYGLAADFFARQPRGATWINM